MRNIKKSWNIRLAGLVLLFWLTMAIGSTQAMPLSDSTNDVWAQQTQTMGSFIGSIDIVQVVQQGSTVIIECKETISTSPSTPIGAPPGPEMSLSYFLLFSDDGDPTDWEAAMMLSLHGSENPEVYWIVTDQREDDIGFWEIEPDRSGLWRQSNTWSMGSEGVHYSIHENQVHFYFVEYEGIYDAEILCVTMAIVGSEIYYDWAPNFYELTWQFQVSTLNTVTTPPLPTTTETITEPLTSITPVSTATTTPASVNTTTTPEEPITSHTETEPEISTRQETSQSESTTPAETPGFEILSILIALPILIWLRRRIR